MRFSSSGDPDRIADRVVEQNGLHGAYIEVLLAITAAEANADKVAIPVLEQVKHRLVNRMLGVRDTT